MNALVEHHASFDNVTLLKLAREIAMDIAPLGDVLSRLQIDQNEWETISKQPSFQGLLRSELEAWQSATNTAERVKLKSLSMVEEVLPEMYARMHDGRENLTAKNEVLKTISRLAGIGGSTVDGSVSGERLSVTINLGADHQLKIEKDVTPKVIDGEST
jgi:hypothetical protein